MNIHTEKLTILQQAIPFVGSLTLTAGLFLTLPLMQWVHGYDDNSQENNRSSVAISIPPTPPQEPPPKEEEKVEEEELELKLELNKISLNQIDLALNAGMGGMGVNNFNSNTFQIADDFADELIFEIADLDEKPEPIARIAPKYPHDLKRAGIQGRVLLIFIVDEKGVVQNARVLQSPHPGFSEAALNAVTAWKFHPGKKEGKAVKTRVRIPLSFAVQR